MCSNICLFFFFALVWWLAFFKLILRPLTSFGQISCARTKSVLSVVSSSRNAMSSVYNQMLWGEWKTYELFVLFWFGLFRQCLLIACTLYEFLLCIHALWMWDSIISICMSVCIHYVCMYTLCVYVYVMCVCVRYVCMCTLCVYVCLINVSLPSIAFGGKNCQSRKSGPQGVEVFV